MIHSEDGDELPSAAPRDCGKTATGSYGASILTLSIKGRLSLL